MLLPDFIEKEKTKQAIVLQSECKRKGTYKKGSERGENSFIHFPNSFICVENKKMIKAKKRQRGGQKQKRNKE